MVSLSKMWNGFKNIIYKKYSENPGKMLLHTGAIGWVLSSAAQITALWFNDKISPEKKMFLIPQELGDAAVNIISFYTLTSGVKYIGKKLTQTGKIRSKVLDELLRKRGYILDKNTVREAGKKYAGDWDFNVEKLPEYETELRKAYKPLNNAAEVVTGLTGSIISSNLITPVIRNYYAAKRQKSMITQYNEWKNSQQKDTNTPRRITFESFTNNAYNRVYTSGGNMKI